jgi:predicted nucleic-acid-binding Zn-ribbon protein
MQDGTVSCAKCGWKDFADARYVQSMEVTDTGISGECIARTCRRCGYEWAEAVRS